MKFETERDKCRKSMYETARDYLLDGKEVVVNGESCSSLIKLMCLDGKHEDEMAQKGKKKLKELKKMHASKDIIDQTTFDTFSHTVQAHEILDRTTKAIKEEKRVNISSQISELIKLSKKIKEDKATSKDIDNFFKKTNKIENDLINNMNGDAVTSHTCNIYRLVKQARYDIEMYLTGENVGFGI